MAKCWLKRTGFPHVSYTTAYDAEAKQYKCTMTQTGFEKHADDPKQVAKNNTGPWDIPIDWAVVKGGKVVREGVFRFSSAEAVLTVDNIDEQPDFMSFARNWSFFGKSRNASATTAELTTQALSDPDAINRYFAYRAIADTEKANVIECLAAGKKDYVVSADFVKLHTTILFDESITPSTRALMLREAEEIPTRPELGYLYQEIAGGKHALLQAVYDSAAPAVLELYKGLEARNKPGPHLEGLHDRALKHHCFNVLSSGATAPTVLSTRNKAEGVEVDIPSMAKNLLLNSAFNSDQTFGFQAYLESDAADVEAVLAQVRDNWSNHPDDTENYIRTLASLDSPRAPKILGNLLDDKIFNINLSGHARTVARGWAAVRKLSMLTPDGLALTVELFLRIAKVNQMSAQPFISMFNDLAKFKGERLQSLLTALRKMQAGLDEVKEASMFNQLTKMLKPYAA